MFMKDPSERITMLNVLKHPWCLQNDSEEVNFSPVMSYPIIAQPGGSALQSRDRLNLEPAETTMTKYLELLYGKELEALNQRNGVIENKVKKSLETSSGSQVII